MVVEKNLKTFLLFICKEIQKEKLMRKIIYPKAKKVYQKQVDYQTFKLYFVKIIAVIVTVQHIINSTLFRINKTSNYHFYNV